MKLDFVPGRTKPFKVQTPLEQTHASFLGKVAVPRERPLVALLGKQGILVLWVTITISTQAQPKLANTKQ